MTLVVVLLLGFGAILIVSAIETDPTTGKSVSVIQTIQQIWNNQVDVSQPPIPGSGAHSSTKMADTLTYQQALIQSLQR